MPEQSDNALMRAFVIPRYGPVSQMRLERITRPRPEAGEVRINVRSVAINDWDLAILRGSPVFMRLFMGWRGPRHKVAGTDIAGIVDCVGDGVTNLQPGDAVYGDLSDGHFGGFAEYVCAREQSLVKKPEEMTFVQAAALAHAGMLAEQGLIELGELQTGQQVLINGAGGGVGTLAVQMARNIREAESGVEVTGVDTGAKLGMMQQIGFDHVVDYREEDVTRRGACYDLILDTRTNRMPWRFLRILNPGGAYVTVGGATANLLATAVLGPLIRRFSGKRVQVLGLKPNKDLASLNGRFTAGHLQPVIDGPYAFDDLPIALQRFADAQHIGKLVVNVS